MSSDSKIDYKLLAQNIKAWGKALGFQAIGITNIDLRAHEAHLKNWVASEYHGNMDYMAENLEKRIQPDQLVPETVRIISVRMNYLPPAANFAKSLKQPSQAYVSRYAVGRDYHKVLRSRLKKLGQKIQAIVPETQFRPFVDSAPVLEHAIAEKSGIGWTGKHSLTLSKEDGSWFFLGELFVNLPLPVDSPIEEQCGACVACLKICPTGAIVEPYIVDGRKCISYLTIENKGVIPIEFREAIGNRIYGCDDCQLICPWNRFAKVTEENDFFARQKLNDVELLTLFRWDETTFLKYTEGSAIRRIGYERWQRNIAVALGNADYNAEIVETLQNTRETTTDLVKSHIDWAIEQQRQKAARQSTPFVTNGERLKSRLIRSVEKGLPRDA